MGEAGDRRPIGIMGGTFDPVHNGHLTAASELLFRAGLQQVWLMPNAYPPHRQQPLAPAEDRMRMVELAVDGRAGLMASRLEIERGGVSYTVDTIRELRQKFAGLRFALLLGADAAQHIDGWHDAKAVLREGSFVIFSRPGTRLRHDELEGLGFPRQRTRLVDVKTPDIAAHEIRRRLGNREAIDEFVPAPVARYIGEHHLYGA